VCPPDMDPVGGSPGADPTRRKWLSSPLSTSVRSLFRRRRTSSFDPASLPGAGSPGGAGAGAGGPDDVGAMLPPVFFLWDTLPESVRFHVVEFVSLVDICSLGEVSWEAYEFSRSGAYVRLRAMWRRVLVCGLPGKWRFSWLVVRVVRAAPRRRRPTPNSPLPPPRITVMILCIWFGGCVCLVAACRRFVEAAVSGALCGVRQHASGYLQLF
jgi:hypothetical protein